MEERKARNRHLKQVKITVISNSDVSSQANKVMMKR
jgi:hypothetical protein